eukprot:7335606-Karenia_brevis.AAC.1
MRQHLVSNNDRAFIAAFDAAVSPLVVIMETGGDLEATAFHAKCKAVKAAYDILLSTIENGRTLGGLHGICEPKGDFLKQQDGYAESRKNFALAIQASFKAVAKGNLAFASDSVSALMDAIQSTNLHTLGLPSLPQLEPLISAIRARLVKSVDVHLVSLLLPAEKTICKLGEICKQADPGPLQLENFELSTQHLDVRAFQI